MVAGLTVDVAALCLVRLALGLGVLHQDCNHIKVTLYGHSSDCDDLDKCGKITYETRCR
jgi:hypothetical protein